MNICIRADGGSIIGMGHLTRTLVLANELRKKHNVFYVCKSSNEYKKGRDFLKDKKFIVKEINENNLNENIKEINADCIITDSYDVDKEYFDILKKNFKISGYIDDNNICDYFDVDFLINQNFYANKLKYKTNKKTKLFLGKEYILLRKEFRSDKKKVINKKIKDIMITVGGSDLNNLTEVIINKLINQNYNLNIVIGSAFNSVNALKKYDSENIKLYFNANMSRLMELSDICISTCGSTIYELIQKGTPIIGIISANNQKKLYKHLNNENLIIYSDINKIDKIIKNITYQDRLSLSKKYSDFIDGNGVYRLEKEIDKMLKYT